MLRSALLLPLLLLTHLLFPPHPTYVQLRVFARTPHSDYAAVSVADNDSMAALKRVIIKDLRLTNAPSLLRLSREVEGGAPVALWCHGMLKGGGLHNGSKVLVQELPSTTRVTSAQLPPPLVFSEEVLGGEPAIVAHLRHPFFLTPAQFSVMERFIWLSYNSNRTKLSMLMLTGPLKAGKSRIVGEVLPRLLSLRFSEAPAGTRRRPVIFHHVFLPNVPSKPALERWIAQLQEFGRTLGIPMARLPHSKAEHTICDVARALAERVHEEGGELWMLLDELGAPIAASTADEARTFVRLFREVVNGTYAYSRTVATGSGMVSLLLGMVDAAVGDFVLCMGTSHVRVGQTPSPALALAMAQRLHASYSTAWPPAAQAHISPQRLLDSLACPSEQAGLTSPRPALVACLCERLGSASAGSPEVALSEGVREVARELSQESRKDVAVGLERTDFTVLLALQRLAERGCRPTEYPLSKHALYLCEEGGNAGPEPAARAALHLLPPYRALLARWIRPDGVLSITSLGCSQPLAPRVLQSLETLTDSKARLSRGLRRRLSACMLKAVSECGMGVPPQPPHFDACPPATVAELTGLPAVSYLLELLQQAAAKSSTARAFREAAMGGADKQALFMETAGVQVLRLLRSAKVQDAFGTPRARACGQTEAAVDELVQRAADLVVDKVGGRYYFNESWALVRAPSAGAVPPQHPEIALRRLYRKFYSNLDLWLLAPFRQSGRQLQRQRHCRSL